VGEVQRPVLMGPSKVSGEVAAGEGRFRPSRCLHGVGPPSREVAELRSRYLVPGSRLAVSTTTRFSEDPLPDAETSGSLSGLGLPSKAYRNDPAGVLRGSGSLHGVSRPYSDISSEVHCSRDSSPGPFRLQGFPPS
jgi:hypothetical protein